MSKIGKIIRREYIEAVRKKTFLLSTILVPVVMIVVMVGSIFLADREPERSFYVAVIDKTGELGPRLFEVMDDTLGNGEKRFSIELSWLGGGDDRVVKQTLMERTESGELDAFIVIPQDILEEGEAEFYSKSVGVLGFEPRFRSALGKLVIEKRLMTEGLSPDHLYEMMRGIKFRTLLVEKGVEKESGFEEQYAVTMVGVTILYMTIMIHGLSVMRSVLEEKSSRVIEIVLSSVTSMQLMIGKILGTGLVSLTQYAIWAFLALIVMSAGPMGGEAAFNVAEYMSVGDFAFMVLFFLLGFLLFGTAYAAIGAMCNSEQEANHLHTPLVMLLVGPMLLAISVIQDPSGTLARVLSFVPFTAPIMMFLRVNVSDVAPAEIALSVLGIVLSIAFMFWIVARIFRVGILMYGKRPNLPELIKWIRYS
jgi:ABC-2 type transport system permease protein